MTKKSRQKHNIFRIKRAFKMNQKAFVFIFKGLSLKCENPTLSNYVVLYFSFLLLLFRSSRSKVFLGKDVLKIYSKCTGKHPCRIFSEYLFLRTPLAASNYSYLTTCHGFTPTMILKQTQQTRMDLLNLFDKVTGLQVFLWNLRNF